MLRTFSALYQAKLKVECLQVEKSSVDYTIQIASVELQIMVRNTLPPHGVQGAPTGKNPGPSTQSKFKSNTPLALSYQN